MSQVHQKLSTNAIWWSREQRNSFYQSRTYFLVYRLNLIKYVLVEWKQNEQQQNSKCCRCCQLEIYFYLYLYQFNIYLYIIVFYIFFYHIISLLDVPVCASSEPIIYGVSKGDIKIFNSSQHDCIVDVAGEPVEIVCQVESNPTDLSFRWTFNNSAELIRYIQGSYI